VRVLPRRGCGGVFATLLRAAALQVLGMRNQARRLRAGGFWRREAGGDRGGEGEQLGGVPVVLLARDGEAEAQAEEEEEFEAIELRRGDGGDFGPATAMPRSEGSGSVRQASGRPWNIGAVVLEPQIKLVAFVQNKLELHH
jgi:hypothetical protein